MRRGHDHKKESGRRRESAERTLATDTPPLEGRSSRGRPFRPYLYRELAIAESGKGCVHLH
jgi:hypothetical protein